VLGREEQNIAKGLRPSGCGQRRGLN
jgi:hypothetical protein